MDDKEKKTEGEETKEEAPTKTAPATEDSDDGKTPKEKSPLEEAKEINAKKEELLNREEKLMERKEKLEAARIVGGQTEAGQTSEPKEETPKEYNARIEKEISEGKHDN